MPTGISYVDETWNPVCGCSKCSPGCLNCYAEKMAARLSCMGVEKYSYVIKARHIDEKRPWNGKVFCDEKALEIPLHWRQPRRILVCSMGDLFHESVPFEFIDKVFRTIRKCPQHTFLILTKWPTVMKEYITGLANRLNGTQLVCMLNFGNWPLPNACLGATICTQKEADEILPVALQIPGFDWISAEPLLEALDFDRYILPPFKDMIGILGDNPPPKSPLIKRIVIGCESINGKPGRFRECEGAPWASLQSAEAEAAFEEAAISIVDQCKAAGVGRYVKQIPINGKVEHDMSKFPKELQVRDEI